MSGRGKRRLKRWIGWIVSISFFIGVIIPEIFVFFFPPPPIWAFSGPPPIFTTETTYATGFFVGTNGDIITNRHAVDACSRITISGYGFRALTVRLIGVPDDPGIDLALLKAGIAPPAVLSFSQDAWPYPFNRDVLNNNTATIFADIGKRTPEQRASGLTIGFPGHEPATLPQVQTVAFAPTVNTSDHLHWTPVINVINGFIAPGDSGSPVLYPSDRVAGVLFSALFDAKTSKPGAISAWEANMPDGLKSQQGTFIPGPAAAAFAQAKGAELTDEVTTSPAKAVVRVYCFQSWP